MELSIAFQTDKPINAYGPLAAQAETYGFDAVTIYNDMLYQPAWLPLLEMARATKRVRVGVAAVNPFTCHPVNIAGNMALIDEASGGRAYLGMARGAWLDFVGVQPRQPVIALAEAMRCVRHLLHRSTAPLAGQFFPLAGGDALRWPILRADVPFLLGSWGAQAIRACIAEISEVKIGGSANPDVIPHFRYMIDDAARLVGGNGGDIGIVVGAVCVVDDDGAAARALARREVALYLPVVAGLDPTVTIDPALLTRLRAAAAQYDFAAAAALISDDLLRRFAFAGSPVEVADQAAELFAAGAARVEFGTPHGLTPADGLRLLGTAVLPRLRRCRFGRGAGMSNAVKPTRADLAAAVNCGIEDVIASGLHVLFVGINPGLYSGWAGYHFARPGNRFWPTLYAAGFTPRQLAPAEQQELLRYGCGVTNFVNRATARADELSAEELAAGGGRLEYLVTKYQPYSVAVLGITAYRVAYAQPRATMGRQAELISGCPVWVLPNPSGLNAHYTLASLADVFRAFRAELERETV